MESDAIATARKLAGAPEFHQKMRDASHRGEAHAQAKLTAEDVRAIRREYVPCVVRQRDLARKYGVNQSVICLILQRKSWGHVK